MKTLIIISIIILIVNTVIVYLQKLLISDVHPKWENNKQIQQGKYRSWYFSLFRLNRKKEILLFLYPLPFRLCIFNFNLSYDCGSMDITILNITLHFGEVKFKWWLNDDYNKDEQKPIFEKNKKD